MDTNRPKSNSITNHSVILLPTFFLIKKFHMHPMGLKATTLLKCHLSEKLTKNI